MDEQQPGSFETTVIGMIEELIRTHADGRAKIATGRNSGVIVTVIPENPDAASIHLHFYDEGGSVDFCFGSMCSPFELDGEDYLDKLLRFSEAVILGRCWESQGLVSHKSWLQPVGTEQKCNSSAFFFPGLPSREKQFAPYSS